MLRTTLSPLEFKRIVAITTMFLSFQETGVGKKGGKLSWNITNYKLILIQHGHWIKFLFVVDIRFLIFLLIHL